ncbi:unnamed protein product [Protopolystoma xenopodis]|uniref:Uncharacterized protein n=1 Tax=Protopolystoma xenopodis TaxID=117903 RepID=A0A3S4ZP78_9PLAT|nr:unnamed protein product [Protopolystoma xenopodis]
MTKSRGTGCCCSYQCGFASRQEMLESLASACDHRLLNPAFLCGLDPATPFLLGLDADPVDLLTRLPLPLSLTGSPVTTPFKTSQSPPSIFISSESGVPIHFSDGFWKEDMNHVDCPSATPTTFTTTVTTASAFMTNRPDSPVDEPPFSPSLDGPAFNDFTAASQASSPAVPLEFPEVFCPTFVSKMPDEAGVERQQEADTELLFTSLDLIDSVVDVNPVSHAVIQTPPPSPQIQTEKEVFTDSGNDADDLICDASRELIDIVVTATGVNIDSTPAPPTSYIQPVSTQFLPASPPPLIHSEQSGNEINPTDIQQISISSLGSANSVGDLFSFVLNSRTSTEAAPTSPLLFNPIELPAEQNKYQSYSYQTTQSEGISVPISSKASSHSVETDDTINITVSTATCETMSAQSCSQNNEVPTSMDDLVVRLTLYSVKMISILDLLTAKRLNASAIKLALTAQSQVSLRRTGLPSVYSNQ